MWKKNTVRSNRVKNLILSISKKYICICILKVWICTGILLATCINTFREGKETYIHHNISKLVQFEVGICTKGEHLSMFLLFPLRFWMTYYLFVGLRVLWNNCSGLYEWSTEIFTQKGAQIGKGTSQMRMYTLDFILFWIRHRDWDYLLHCLNEGMLSKWNIRVCVSISDLDNCVKADSFTLTLVAFRMFYLPLKRSFSFSFNDSLIHEFNWFYLCLSWSSLRIG